MSEVLKAFKFDGEPVTKEPYGSGHINSTFLVVTDKNKKYILQKINNKIFPNVEGLMNNIMLVTEHLKKKTEQEFDLSTATSISKVQEETTATEEIFTLSGQKVNTMQPGQTYVVKKGNKVRKVINR